MLKPVEKISASRNVIDQLTDSIRKGVWEPGELLPTEMDLSRIFNVSRNSIREALKSMTYSGLLAARAGYGTYVKDDALQKLEQKDLVDFITEEASVNDLIETRTLLESELARLAAIRATDEDRKELQRIQDVLEAALLENERKGLDSIPAGPGSEFHMCVARASKNSVMIKLMTSIKAELDLQRSKMHLQTEQDFDTMLQDHKAICEAVVSGDAERAARTMREHVRHSYAIMLKTAGSKE